MDLINIIGQFTFGILQFIFVYCYGMLLTITPHRKINKFIIRIPQIISFWIRPKWLFPNKENRETARLIGIIYQCLISFPSLLIFPITSVLSNINCTKIIILRYIWSRITKNSILLFAMILVLLELYKYFMEIKNKDNFSIKRGNIMENWEFLLNYGSDLYKFKNCISDYYSNKKNNIKQLNEYLFLVQIEYRYEIRQNIKLSNNLDALKWINYKRKLLIFSFASILCALIPVIFFNILQNYFLGLIIIIAMLILTIIFMIMTLLYCIKMRKHRKKYILDSVYNYIHESGK